MRFISIFIIVFCLQVLQAQNTCYRIYTLEEFARLHFSDSMLFYKAYMESARYSAIMRENGIEGIVDVEVINHSDSDFDVKLLNDKRKIFEISIYDTILKTRKHWLNTNIPFILKFCVEYDLVFPKENRTSKPGACKLKLIDYHLSDLGDTNTLHNSNQLSYWPQIIRYEDQVVFNDPRKYHPTESLEQLLELAIKKCCRKNIQLTHMIPPAPHSEPTGGKKYIPITDYMSVIFNKQGYISEIRLNGKLKKKIDPESIFKVLKNMRFHPALFGTTPVDAFLEFKAE